jgi:hypothetical protein
VREAVGARPDRYLAEHIFCGERKNMNRPTEVTIIAILSFLSGGLAALLGCGFLLGGAMIASFGMSLPTSLVGIGVAIFACVFFGLAALDVITGIGLLNMKNWARILAIVIVGLGLLFAVLGILNGLLHFRIFVTLWEAIIAAIDLWVLTYLFKPEAQQAFGTTGF